MNCDSIGALGEMRVEGPDSSASAYGCVGREVAVIAETRQRMRLRIGRLFGLTRRKGITFV